MESGLRAMARWILLGALCLLISPLPALAQDEGGGGGDSAGESSSESSASASSESDSSGDFSSDGEDRTEDSSIWQSSSRGTSD